MAKDSFRRYIWMLDKIQRHGRITLAALKEEWRRSSVNDENKELAPRTFANYKENIEEIFGIEIACDRATNEYYIVNEDNLDNNAIRDWMLNSLSLRNLLNESAGLHDRIILEDVPSSHRFLTVVIDAMRDNKKLSLSYKGYSMSEHKEMVVYPYSIRLFKRRWYMIGYSEYSQDVRLYMLDRAEAIAMLDDKFVMPEDFDAEGYFEDYYGVRGARTQELTRLVVKVKANRCDLIRNLPLHSSQKEIEITNEYSIFEVYLRPNFDLKQELISYMDSIEVIQPEFMRNEMRATLRSMCKMYNSKSQSDE
jgi:hypothetical protein